MHIIKRTFLISFHSVYREEEKVESKDTEQKITIPPLSSLKLCCLALSWGWWSSCQAEMQQVASFFFLYLYIYLGYDSGTV